MIAKCRFLTEKLKNPNPALCSTEKDLQEPMVGKTVVVAVVINKDEKNEKNKIKHCNIGFVGLC